MARCCGCKLIGGDELCCEKIKNRGNVVHNLLPHIKMMARCCGYDGDDVVGGECRAQPSSPYKDDGEMLWVGQCRAQPSSPYKDGEMMGACRAQPSSPYKDDGEMLWNKCRAQPSSPYKDDGEMLWV
ncbi:hypothetical protein KSF78_0009646 [Schistosoma japonicum]|nr:hypothetical protein KSF78_0009646 [Schistosoma japonicum]